MANIGDLQWSISAGWDAFLTESEKQGRKAGDKAGGSFSQSFGSGIQKLAATAVFAGLSKQMLELDNATKQYQATVGATAAEADAARAKTTELWKSNLVGMQDILGVMANLRTDQGQTEAGAEKLAEAYLKWARVAGTDAPEAVKQFDDVLDAFHLTAQDGERIMDELVASNQKYGGSLQQRVQDLKTLAPAIQAYGLDVNDAISLENLLAASGLDASSAMGALKKGVENLQPGQSLDDLIRQVSSIEDPTLRAQKAIELFGARGGVAFANVLQPGITSIKDFGVSAEEAAGKTRAAAAVMDSSVPNQLKLFFQGLSGDIISALGSNGSLITSVATGVLALKSLGLSFDALNLSAKTAWATVLLLPLAFEKVGEAYDLVRNAVFGSNRAIDQWTDAAHGGAEAAKTDADAKREQAEATLAEARAAATSTEATGDETDAIETNTGATGDNSYMKTELVGSAADAADQAETLRLRLVGETGAAISAAQGTADVGSAAAGAVGPLADAGGAAVDTANDFGSLAIRAREAYSAITQALLAQQGAGAGAISSAEALAQGFGNVDAAATLSLGTITKHTGATRAHTGASQADTKAAKDQADAQRELARTTKVDVSEAFDRAKETAHALFAALHEEELQGIRDERDRKYAVAQTTAELARQHLEEARSALFAPVDAAQAAFDAERKARARADLVNQINAETDAIAWQRLVQQLADQDRQDALDAQRVAAQAAADALDATANDPKTGIDATLAAAEKAADTAADTATAKANATYKKVVSDFDDSLSSLEKHLTAAKTGHAKVLSEIDDLYKKFGISTKPRGAEIGKALAAGLRSEVKDVENAASALAAAVNKYIKVGSPAEKGPLHDNPPDVMGERIGTQWAGGIVTAIQAAAPTMSAAAQAAIPVLLGPPELYASQNDALARGGVAAAVAWAAAHPGVGVTPPPAAPIVAPAYGTPAYQGMIDAWQATAVADNPGSYGMGRYGPLYDVTPGPRTVGEINADTSGMAPGVQVDVHVNNPAPEPASTSTKRELQLLAASGILEPRRVPTGVR